ncbi:hypothetical protein PS655_05907 [Pseudomonas fluorescens]|uniref:Uncharacterized protein n=1 Tax=Pseudomonas fluorescens TaxID=294 RepID=A0A5E6XZ38_PSEFL|nr:hypothetical protein PS655_05907 [Pseudomonas fluorescens]
MFGGDLARREVANDGGSVSRQRVRPLLGMLDVFPTGTMGLYVIVGYVLERDGFPDALVLSRLLCGALIITRLQWVNTVAQ